MLLALVVSHMFKQLSKQLSCGVRSVLTSRLVTQGCTPVVHQPPTLHLQHCCEAARNYRRRPVVEQAPPLRSVVFGLDGSSWSLRLLSDLCQHVRLPLLLTIQPLLLPLPDLYR